MAGDAQLLVRRTMLAAGGYWRPLAAVARLLEELGELSELLFVGEEPGEAIAGELADLWIITTALADQFLTAVEDPASGSEAEADFGVLVAAAGPVARVVNHYDGPKVPRQGEPMPTLQGSIAGFHMALQAFATARRIDLAVAVAEKIEHIHARGDIERFGREGFDPSTAPVLDARPEGAPARLWGAPEPAPGETAAQHAARVRGPLTMFAKAARAERLDGVLISVAAGEEARWLRELVVELDPGGRPARFALAGEGLSARLLTGAAAPVALVELAKGRGQAPAAQPASPRSSTPTSTSKLSSTSSGIPNPSPASSSTKPCSAERIARVACTAVLAGYGLEGEAAAEARGPRPAARCSAA